MFRIGQYYGMRRKELIGTTGEVKEITSYFKILNVPKHTFPGECLVDIKEIRRYEHDDQTIIIASMDKGVHLDTNMFKTGQLWRITEVNFEAIIENMFDDFKKLF